MTEPQQLASNLPPPGTDRAHRMRMDLAGRLRNTKVAVQDAFLPLFETVVNSIHATEERFGAEVSTKGRVEVEVLRVPQLPLPGVVGRPPVELIESFSVIDNGSGFTDANLDSFETADSSAKLTLGGKGIGRFTWLVVFKKAEVESTFLDSTGRLRRRSFAFCPSETGITNYQESDADDTADLRTCIRLSGVQPPYAEILGRGPEVIADRIFEHCFNYFALNRCPVVRVIDARADGLLDLTVNNRLAELDIESPEPLRLGNHELRLRHVWQKYASGRKHMGHLCADERVVTSFPLSEVSDLSSEPIRLSSGDTQVHHVFVGGEALDSSVDITRTRFNLPDGAPIIEASGLLDLKTLREAVGANINERLADLLQTEREENFRRIEHHIRTSQPEYARLLEHKREQLHRIKWSDNPRQMDESLYRVKQTWELEIRQQQAEVEQKLIADKTELDQVADELYRVVSETNLAGQADLVRYVTKRRAVLNLLSTMTSRFQGPALEKHIHQIVFPLRNTNGQIAYDDHNLWLVDDTLSFYEFVASDIPLSQNSASPSDSPQRPDILAFKTGDPFQHVSLVEFKRPDRDDENPVEQLAKYGRLLRRGGAIDAQGRTLPGISLTVRIDAYAVVTLTPKMEELLEMSPGEIKRVEGEWRWHGTISSLNMSVEVLDFRAFIRRAEQRNQAFFKTLGFR
ncbi:MAG: hypothetical protein WAM82_11765 [Thermoanaerobaculia bacterium]